MARTRSTIAGRVDVTTLMLRDRRVVVRIYLPADYERTDHRYPVLYMFDGHNLFDRTTSTYNKEWRIDETMEWIGRDTPYDPAVVVGIDAPPGRYDRYAMYSVGEWDFRIAPQARRRARIQGYGDATAAFLFTEVKPFVEATYRVHTDRDAVGVGGSSMGGYMALYSAAHYPELLSKVIALSPVVLDFPMNGQRVLDALAASGVRLPQRFFLEMGSKETLDYASPNELVAHLGDIERSLLTAGHEEVFARVIPNGRHDERWWAKQFTGAYLWTFHGIDPDPWV